MTCDALKINRYFYLSHLIYWLFNILFTGNLTISCSQKKYNFRHHQIIENIVTKFTIFYFKEVVHNQLEINFYIRFKIKLLFHDHNKNTSIIHS